MKTIRIVAWSWAVLSSLFMLVVIRAELIPAHTIAVYWMLLYLVREVGACTIDLFVRKRAWMTTEDYQPTIIQMPWAYERTSSAPEPLLNKLPLVVRLCVRCDKQYIVRGENSDCPKCAESSSVPVEKQEKFRRFIDLRGE